jgi:hypothetical protein
MIYLCKTSYSGNYYIVDIGRGIRTIGYSTISEAVKSYSKYLHMKIATPDTCNVPPQRQILYSGDSIPEIAELMGNYPELFI